MTTSPLEIVRSFYTRIWNRGEYAAADRLCHDDLTFRGSLGQVRRGREEFLEYVRSVREGLSDYVCELQEAVVEGDRVFARMLFSGVHTGMFEGVAPTGARVRWAGAALFTLEEDRIRDLWVLGDVKGLHDQLSAGG